MIFFNFFCPQFCSSDSPSLFHFHHHFSIVNHFHLKASFVNIISCRSQREAFISRFIVHFHIISQLVSGGRLFPKQINTVTYLNAFIHRIIIFHEERVFLLLDTSFVAQFNKANFALSMTIINSTIWLTVC